jgi:hypothetical protein
MPSYVFRDGPIPLLRAEEADPQELGEAMERLSRQIEQKIAAGEGLGEADALARLIHAEVVQAGTAHPFYKHLEWNDKRGAYLHRLSQIRAIIRIIRVVADNGQQRPAFLNVKIASGGMQTYRPVDVVINNLDLQIAVLRRAEADLAAFLRRYQMFADICARAADLERAVRELRERMMTDGGTVSSAA